MANKTGDRKNSPNKEKRMSKSLIVTICMKLGCLVLEAKMLFYKYFALLNSLNQLLSLVFSINRYLMGLIFMERGMGNNG
jgi:hypothetical protein